LLVYIKVLWQNQKLQVHPRLTQLLSWLEVFIQRMPYALWDPTTHRAFFVWIYTTRAWRWLSRVETGSLAFILYIIYF